MRSKLMVATAAAAIGLVYSGSAAAAPSERCDTESVQAMAPPDTTVAFAAREQGGCRVSGYVTTRNPGPNKVLFVLAMPDNFNNRYVYLGVGGAGGQLPTLQPVLLARGYVLAGSDGGSGAKSGADFSFKNDPGRTMDFVEGRGVHVTAVATQAITRKYYGSDQLRRYVSGCSGGGQMGLGNARRLGGQDFDGFLVGATPWPTTAYMPHVFRIARHLQTNPQGWISPDLMKKARAAILATYDNSDGVVDGIIADQRNIASFDTGILSKAGFSPAQIETFELIRGPYTYSGKGLTGPVTNPGFPITDVGSWSSFLLGSGTVTPAEMARRGAPFIHTMADTNTRAQRPGVDYWSVANLSELVGLATRDGLDMPLKDPMDFSALAQSKAKMIVYHGVNDQAMGYLETVAGYDLLAKRFPQANNWVRAFAVPGLLHCRGGDGPIPMSVCWKR